MESAESILKSYKKAKVPESILSPWDKFRIRLAKLSPKDREEFLNSNRETIEVLRKDPLLKLRPNQTVNLEDESWRTWVNLGGRGSGKTFSSKGAILKVLRDHPGTDIGLMGQTNKDAWRNIVDGQSGIKSLATTMGFKFTHCDASTTMHFKSQSNIYCVGARNSDALAGSNLGLLVIDELALWSEGFTKRDLLEIVDNASHAVRCAPGKIVISTTPRPGMATQTLQAIIDRSNTLVTNTTTFDNFLNLHPSAIDSAWQLLKTSPTGRQEILGELPREVFFNRDLIKFEEPPSLSQLRIVVSVDPQKTTTAKGDETGIIVLGYSELEGKAYILDDRTKRYSSIDNIIKQISRSVDYWEAHSVIFEANIGGDWATELITKELQRIDRPYTRLIVVNPVKNKLTRAEQVLHLYTNGQVKHVRRLEKIEKELLEYNPNDKNQDSPNRLDSIGHGLQEFFKKNKSISQETKAHISNTFSYFGL